MRLPNLPINHVQLSLINIGLGTIQPNLLLQIKQFSLELILPILLLLVFCLELVQLGMELVVLFLEDLGVGA
jgi:hypothetical protein